ncbi:hypothetical protein A2818_02510 [Candidatus Nomurabacteria bacterium RIFCSPHIGHO2_01_FULL_40_12]|uniref:Uncharacterized protein n=1 Tax=Candidatus Nomurabacteria bacterium RIFCSPHIGHO2_01_FULL_40_12 TaxID=1801737 RepID=A0A1F6UYC0_9BACT|nr:MAG: hypothetical protein A2818_02510 [Candidatus Nomurabacteria bacterium RIFCSPHIGHO2_01_FULL_40_12]
MLELSLQANGTVELEVGPAKRRLEGAKGIERVAEVVISLFVVGIKTPVRLAKPEQPVPDKQA